MTVVAASGRREAECSEAEREKHHASAAHRHPPQVGGPILTRVAAEWEKIHNGVLRQPERDGGDGREQRERPEPEHAAAREAEAAAPAPVAQQGVRAHPGEQHERGDRGQASARAPPRR